MSKERRDLISELLDREVESNPRDILTTAILTLNREVGELRMGVGVLARQLRHSGKRWKS